MRARGLRRALADRPLLAAAGLALAATLVRLIVLSQSRWDLGQDEAQYWWWSEHLAWGYFTKPPLIAGLVKVSTVLFGSGEFGVRALSAACHAGSAVVLAGLAKALFDARTAVLAAAVWLTLPAVAVSSGLATTDAPLLFFWSLALLFAHEALASARPPALAGAALGAAFGLGFLAKYAMIYFAGGLVLVLVLIPDRRPRALAALAAAAPVALALAAPNVLWNMENGYSTLAHTAANADWGAERFNPGTLAAFALSQFAVAGPVAGAALVWAAATWRRRLAEVADPEARARLVFLAAFVAPPLLAVSVQAFISRANANWAAAAYPAAAVLVAWLIGRPGRRALLVAVLGVNGAACLAVAAAALAPGLAARFGAPGALAEVSGWREQARAIAAYTEGYDVVLADDRGVMSALLYYAPNLPAPVRAWDPNRCPDQHYEAFLAYEPRPGDRALLASRHFPDAPPVRRAFSGIRRVAIVEAPYGAPGRVLWLFELQEVRAGAFNTAPECRVAE